MDGYPSYAAAWSHEQAAAYPLPWGKSQLPPQGRVERGGRFTFRGPTMAMYPCDVTGHRYRSAQQTMYPAVVDGINTVRRKLRMCPEHFDGLLDHLREHAQHAQEEFDSPTLTSCFLCSTKVTGSDAMVFVTVYAKGQERDDWWAPLHEECVSGALEDLYLDARMA